MKKLTKTIHLIEQINKAGTYLILLGLYFFLFGCESDKAVQADQEYGKGEHIKIMKFHADWCPPCQAMQPEYNEIKKIYRYIEFEDIDFDKNEKKVTAYNVESIPLLIKSKNGKEIRRHTGYMSKNDLIWFIEKM